MADRNTIARLASGNLFLYVLSAILVIMAYNVFFGIETLVPTNINWLLSVRHDWGQHYLGWAFYRNESWSFPLGRIDSLIYPVGTNVGYWDSIPLLAIFFKIFSPLLPDDFQYIGIWMLFCYLMAAWYTIKIFKLYNAKAAYIIIGVLFIACNPVLVYRGLHPALCAHGFIIAAIYYYLKPATPKNVGALNKSQMALAIISSLVNPYICVMVLGFSIILPLKHYFYGKLLKPARVLLYIGATLAGIILIWLIVGMISLGGNSLDGGGYGILSFNLNSLYNSSGFSVFLPQVAWQNPGQYEGFMYLGLGMMIAIALAVAYVLCKRSAGKAMGRKKFLLPLFLLVALFALFAISNKVTFNESLLFEIPIPRFVSKLGSIFRACGRFLWPAYYLIFFFALLILMKSRFPQWLKVAVLALLLAVQLYDSKPLYTSRNLAYGPYDTPLDEAKWNAIIPGYDRMITYPPFQNHLLNNMDYQDLCFLALKNNKAISTGYAARENPAGNQAYTDSLSNALDNDELQANELYITTPQHINAFAAVIHGGKFDINYLDGYYLFYAKDRSGGQKIVQTPEAVKKADSVRAVYMRSNFINVIDKPVFTEDKIQMNIEGLVLNDGHFRINGWAFLTGKSNNKGDSVFVAVSAHDKTYIARTEQVPRPDVTEAFKKENLENSGFSASVFTEGLEKEDYTISLAIKSADGKWEFRGLGTAGEIKKRDKPFAITKLPATSHQLGNVDDITISSQAININGWSAFDDADSDDNEILAVLSGKGSTFAIATNGVIRQDVTNAYNNKYKYDKSGFSVKIMKKDLKKGEYKAGILLRNKKTGRESFMATGKTFEIK